MKKKYVFTGSGVALTTPMHTDGSVNYEVMEQLLEFHIANGTDAIVSCATTGESPTLSHKEHTEILRFVVKKVAGRLPVIAGTGSNDTRYAIELSQEALEAGADALLMVTPYYNKTSQTGLVRHYFAIADRVNLPIILYNVPSRTGCNIKPETYRQLSEHPNIVATKEANGDISSVAQTIALCGDSLTIYSGNDEQLLPMLALGGKGIISTSANILPRQMHDICADFFAGDLEKSRNTFLKYVPLMNALFMDVNPIPLKEAMNGMGFHVGGCRLPLTSMADSDRAKLVSILHEYELIP